MTSTIFVCILVAIFVLAYSLFQINSRRSERSKTLDAYDPLDGQRLVDPCDLCVPGPNGQVILKVNRINALIYRRRGPQAFPNFCRADSANLRSIYYCSNGIDFDLVDAFFIYSMLFGSNIPDQEALECSWQADQNAQDTCVPDEGVAADVVADPSYDSTPSSQDQPTPEKSYEFGGETADSSIPASVEEFRCEAPEPERYNTPTPSYEPDSCFSSTDSSSGGCDSGGGCDCGGGGGCD